ncbi:MAG: AMMECR1 domain-containing protein [Caldivirga sp.]
MDFFKPLQPSDGAALVKLARYAIESRLGLNVQQPNIPSAERLRAMSLGVWVSIEKIRVSNGVRVRELRGNIGSPYPMRNLYDDVMTIARYVAFNSPKYSPLSPSDVKRIVVEVIVNNQPRQIDISNLGNILIPGYHGLIVKRPNGSVEAYLPHRVVELAERLINEENKPLTMDLLITAICSKGCIEVKLFETQIFYELEPRGEVIERALYMNKYLRGLKPLKGVTAP